MMFMARMLETRTEAYLVARHQAAAFLLGHLNLDGSIGPVEEGIFYGRVP